MSDDLLPRKDAARRLLGCSESTLDKLTSEGRLPSEKRGGRVFYRCADIDAFVATLRIPVSA